MKKLYFFALLSIVYFLCPTIVVYGQFSSVTHTSGTASSGGRTVTVTSSGTTGSFSTCGPTLYSVGVGSSSPSGSYTFSFNAAVTHLKLGIAGLSRNQNVSVSVNGSSYSLATSNFSSPTGTFCGSSIPAATVSGGLMVGSTYPSGGTLDITSCSGITTCTISTSSVRATGGFYFIFQFDTQPEISGSSALCTGTPSSFSGGVSGGTWSASDAAVATVNSSGQVTGVATGSATISYSVASGSCTNVATKSITVNTLPHAGAISGSTSLCSGASYDYADTSVTVTWSTTNSSVVAINSSGHATALTHGSASILCINSNICGSDTASLAVSVTTTPAAGIGGTVRVCVGGAGSAFTSTGDATSTSTFTSSSPGVSLIDTSRFTAIAPGVATITNTIISSTCGSASTVTTVVVKDTAAFMPITADGSVICAGRTLTLTEPDSGGVWVSSSDSIARVSSTGVVTAVSVGTVTISYTDTSVCSRRAAIISLNIHGLQRLSAIHLTDTNICAGGIRATCDTTGGIWASSNSSVLRVDTAGNLFPSGYDTASVTYTKTNDCGSATVSKVVSVGKPRVRPVEGNSVLCPGGTSALSDSTSGGTWSSSNAFVIPVTAGGTIRANAGMGSATITYTVSNLINNCRDSVVTIAASIVAIDAGKITGKNTVCMGDTAYLYTTYSTGVWSVDSSIRMVADSFGNKAATSLPGAYNLVYTVTKLSCTASARFTLNVDDSTVAPILSVDSLCLSYQNSVASVQDNSIICTDATPRGYWNSRHGQLSYNYTATSARYSGLIPGLDTITYAVNNACGTHFVTKNVLVKSVPNARFNGIDSICAGATAAYLADDTTVHGNWASSNPAIATIDTTGTVRGLSEGFVTITYTAPGTYCNGVWYKKLRVDNHNTSPITGLTSICTGELVTLTAANHNGSWISRNTSKAQVKSADYYNSLLYYDYTTGGYSTYLHDGYYTDSFSSLAEHNYYSSIASTYPTDYLSPSYFSYSDFLLYRYGGIYEFSNYESYYAAFYAYKSNPYTHNYSNVTGVLGVAAGTTNIVYTVNNACGIFKDSVAVTIRTKADTPSFAVPAKLCSNSRRTLTASVTGGTWSSSDTMVAAINNSGLLRAKSGGTAYITYTTSGTFCTNYNVRAIEVEDTLSLPSVSGGTTTCEGDYFSLDGGLFGGTWLSSNPLIAYADGSGNVFANSAGSSLITYRISNSCNTDTATTRVYVVARPSTPVITGSTLVCANTYPTYTTTAAGGVWSVTPDYSSYYYTGADIDTNGILTSPFANFLNINYTVSNTGCSVTGYLSVHVTDSSVHRSVSSVVMCSGTAVTLGTSQYGGMWTISDSSILTRVPGSSTFTSHDTGSVLVTYSATNHCLIENDSFRVAVRHQYIAGVVSGPGDVCLGSIATYALTGSDATVTGLWKTSDSLIASVDNSGILHTHSKGNITVQYIVGAGEACPGIADIPVAVSKHAVPSAITGSSVCVGATGRLFNYVNDGGIWSSSDNTVAIFTNPYSSPETYVSGDISYTWYSGTVTGVSAGTAIVTYSIVNSCGSAFNTYRLTVNARPGSDTLAGPDHLCSNGSIMLIPGSGPGGSWMSSNTSVAVVSDSGTVTATRSRGTYYDTLILNRAPQYGSTYITFTPYSTYGCSGSAVSKWVTVDTILHVPSLSTPDTVCAGAVAVGYQPVPAGGTWSVANTSTAIVTSDPSVDGSVLIKGLRAGTTTLTYTVSSACGNVSVHKTLTVRSSTGTPGTITASTPICLGSTTTAHESVSSGAWSTSGASASIDTSGRVTAISPGNSVISYTVGSRYGCQYVATKAITVDNLPRLPEMVDTTSICSGSVVTYTYSGYSGNWSSSDPSSVYIFADARATGSGTVTATYTLTNSCGTDLESTTLIVTALPDTGIITGPSQVCLGSTIYLSDTARGGYWSISDPSIATINDTGLVTGRREGTATVYYTVNGGSCENRASFQISCVHPTVSITSTVDSITAGDTLRLFATMPFGTWSSSDTNIAIVDTTGLVTGRLAGAIRIYYTINSYCGPVSASLPIRVGLPILSAGYIVGPDTTCLGTTAHFSDTLAGGRWLSSDTLVATIDTMGNLLATATGTTVVIYQVVRISHTGDSATFIYDTAMVSHPVTIIQPATAGVISGNLYACPAGTSLLFDSTAIGDVHYWSSSNASVASVSVTGSVHAIVAGTATITFTTSNVCSNAYTTAVFTVNRSAMSGTITGVSTICPGASATDSSTISGGTWSSSDSAIAFIDAFTGTVYGVSAGSATISYIYTNSCGSDTSVASVTVSPLPAAGTISGATTLCPAASSILTSSVTGGSWATSNAAVASVNAVGSILGVASGTATVTYTYTNSCGTDFTTVPVTVNDLPFAGSISGAAMVCEGVTTLLSATDTGGTWSSSDDSIVSVDASGTVYGVSPGSATIFYSVHNTCGTATTSHGITVNPVPVAGVISGAHALCYAVTTTLIDSISGGTWSSGDTAVATVSEAGIVTGISAGTTTISYAVTTSCGTDYATWAMTVNPLPDASTISGSATVCVGASTVYSATAAGGIWNTANGALATVDSSGLVTGVVAGNVSIRYIIADGCGSDTTFQSITINPRPFAGTLTGTSSVCNGSSVSLTASVSGGEWSSGDTTIATVNTSGMVTGLAPGSAVIQYAVANMCGIDTSTVAFTVNPLPDAGIISGAPTVCAGAAAVYTTTGTPGAWSSSDSSIATVDSSGSARGIRSGMVSITYIAANSCGMDTTATSVNVMPLPVAGTITGVASIAFGDTTMITASVTGGTWSSLYTSIATISAAGVAGGVSVGTDTIIYSVTNSCGTVSTSTQLIVSATAAGTISGSSAVCVGSTITLSSTVSGGTWSSSAIAYARVNSAGVVTGVVARAVTITYTVGSARATYAVTVQSSAVSSIAGASSVCLGSSTTLTDASAGGSWSSSNTALATVSSAGVVYGVMTGTDTIIYTVTNTCGTFSVRKTITVTGAPTVSSISGSTAPICAGSTGSYAITTGGGVWSLSNTTIGTVTSSGTSATVSAIAGGVDTLIYTVTNSCGFTARAIRAITFNPTAYAPPITGPATVPVAASITLADSIGGGVWSHTAPSTVATLSSSGVLTGRGVGVDTVKYTVTTTCGSATTAYPVTVTPIVVTISGPSTVCTGGSITLTGSVSGGTWSTSASAYATVTSGGVVTGRVTGNVVITYTVGSSSFGIYNITILGPGILSIAGASSVCPDATTTYTDATAGGTWSNAFSAIGTISSTGDYSALTSGTDTVIYNVTNACGSYVTRKPITITGTPFVTAISAVTGNGCLGNNNVLRDIQTGGVWSFADTTIARIVSVSSPSVTVTGITTGVTTLSYTVTNSCGLQGSATTPITINDIPALSAITGPSTVVTGSTITLATASTGGTWSSGTTAVATVNPGGIVRGVSAGSSTISYSKSNACGTNRVVRVVTVVSSKPAGSGVTAGVSDVVNVFPNPSGGVITIAANATIGKVYVTDLTGKFINEVNGGALSLDVDLSNYASGTYLIRVVTENGITNVKVIKE